MSFLLHSNVSTDAGNYTKANQTVTQLFRKSKQNNFFCAWYLKPIKFVNFSVEWNGRLDDASSWWVDDEYRLWISRRDFVHHFTETAAVEISCLDLWRQHVSQSVSKAFEVYAQPAHRNRHNYHQCTCVHTCVHTDDSVKHLKSNIICNSCLLTKLPLAEWLSG